MKTIRAGFVLAASLFLIVSCSTLYQEVREAHIHTTANIGVVAGHSLVASWTANYNAVYSDQSVAVLEADKLAKEGWHDIWVYVEYVSIVLPESIHPRVFCEYKWRVSIYR